MRIAKAVAVIEISILVSVRGIALLLYVPIKNMVKYGKIGTSFYIPVFNNHEQ